MRMDSRSRHVAALLTVPVLGAAPGVAKARMAGGLASPDQASVLGRLILELAKAPK